MDHAMRQVNIHEAKTTLSQLVEAAESGERVVIARAGKPVAELVRLRESAPGIRLGGLRGRIPEQLLDDVAEPMTRQQVEALFGGRLEP
jgi:prevent-host-death family protein